MFLQGVYLLTSIGLNITKRTQFYPVATMAAAAVNVGLNFLLIPRYGIVGAAWANGAAYAVQAGARLHPVAALLPDRYEWGRIARVCIAAVIAAIVAAVHSAVALNVDPRSTMAHLPDVLTRGATVIAMFAGLLAVTGFFHAEELRRLRALRGRGTPARTTVRGRTARRWPARSWPRISTRMAEMPQMDTVGPQIHGWTLGPRITRGWTQSGQVVYAGSVAVAVRRRLALALRLYGLRYGLPAVYNPDEVAIMSRALAFAKGDLNPHNFLYPSFYFYALFAWEGLTALAAVATRTVASFGEFQREFFLDPTRVFVAGRLSDRAHRYRDGDRDRRARREAVGPQARDSSPPCSSPSRRCTSSIRTTSSTTCR